MRGVFAPMWDEVVTSLGRITIREQVVHGESELLSERKLPLICIGDSLWNCGLGGGGILAMQDALQIANLMTGTYALSRLCSNVARLSLHGSRTNKLYCRWEWELDHLQCCAVGVLYIPQTHNRDFSIQKREGQTVNSRNSVKSRRRC